MVRDSSLSDAGDYVSVAAIAILEHEDDPEQIQWIAARHAIIDEHRRIHGRNGSARRQFGRNEELLAQPEQLASEIVGRLTPDEQGQLRRQLEAAKVPAVSLRQVEVFRLLATGMTSREVANELFLSEQTVRTHCRNVLRTLGVPSRLAALGRLLKLGYIQLDELP